LQQVETEACRLVVPCLISAAAHALLALLIFSATAPAGPLPRRAVFRNVSVDLISLQRRPRVTAPDRQPAVTEPVARPPEPVRPPSTSTRTLSTGAPVQHAETEATDDLTVATALLSRSVFEGKKGKAVLASIQEASSGEAHIQLCNVETLEQLNARFPARSANYVVPYAGGPMRISDSTLEAQNAAIRFNDGWAWLKFRCHVDPDQFAVTLYAFKLGAPIPEEDLLDLPLPER